MTKDRMTKDKALQILIQAIDNAYGFSPDSDRCLVTTFAGMRTNEYWLEVRVSPKNGEYRGKKIKALIAQEECILHTEELYSIAVWMSEPKLHFEHFVFYRKEGNT